MRRGRQRADIRAGLKPARSAAKRWHGDCRIQQAPERASDDHDAGGALTMTANHIAQDSISSWLERQYCASVAATLLPRTAYFEYLEDAMGSPGALGPALSPTPEH